MATEPISVLTELPIGFKSNFSRLVAQYLKDEYQIRLADVSVDALAGQVESQIAEIMPRSFGLITTRPDFESVLVQLMAEVERTGSWADADLSATGQMILRAVAANVDFSQFSIARSLQEAYIHSARSENSIMLAARMLGNRVVRHIPAEVLVTFDRGDPGPYLQLSRWEQFVINDVPFFSRTPVTFPEDSITTQATLYQGEIKSTVISSTGVKYQTIEIGTEQFNISEHDVWVEIEGFEWVRTQEPLWHFGPLDRVFFENTLQNGNVLISFGNGLTAAAPTVGSDITVRWVETLGAAGMSNLTAQRVDIVNAISGLGTVIGTTQTAIINGADRKDAAFYQQFGSNRRAAVKRAVIRKDYRAQAMTYPGVIDARFRGQAELNPNKPSWMNIVGATLLTDRVFNENDWSNFVSYMSELGIFQTKMLRLDPTPLPYTISAVIYCRPEANLTAVKTELTKQVQAVTKLRAGSLGFSYYMSDFNDMLEGSGTIENLVEYIELLSPISAIVCSDVFQYARCDGINLSMAYSRRIGFEGRLDRGASTPPRDQFNLD